MNSKKFRKKIVQLINNQWVQSMIYSPLTDYIVWSILSFIKKEARKIPAGARVLDAGAGELRYKKYFSHCDYVSQDLCVGDREWYFDEIDVRSDICNIPLEDGSFDYILCTQVLEHLEFPDRAIIELARILKKGGKLLLTAPLGQGEHQAPFDFFRFTKYALKSLGERSSLRLVSVRSAGGIFINLEYILWQTKNVFLPFQDLALMRYFYFIILLPLKLLSGVLFVLLDYFDKEKTYTNNYNCVYEKVS